jgi:NADPH:quinone reductase
MKGATMTAARSVRAVRLVAHGKPLEVDDVDLVEPSDADVLVEMAYAGVNPVDRYVALGRVAPDGPLPRTMGVEGVGKLDGRWVVMHGHGLAAQRDGLWAEAAVVPADAVVDVPDGVEPTAAAAMGVAGATAWRTVTELARVGPADRVLVLGASGGVGSIIVSLVRSIGAVVWGQTGQESKADAVRSRGASRAVVSRRPDDLVPAVAELSPTVVFDPLGGDFTGAAIEALTGHGRLVLFGTSAAPEGRVPLQSLYRKNLSVLGFGGLAEPPDAIRRGMQGALEALREGRLEVAVDDVLALGEANVALQRLADRAVSGKLVLDTGR